MLTFENNIFYADIGHQTTVSKDSLDFYCFPTSPVLVLILEPLQRNVHVPQSWHLLLSV